MKKTEGDATVCCEQGRHTAPARRPCLSFVCLCEVVRNISISLFARILQMSSAGVKGKNHQNMRFSENIVKMPQNKPKMRLATKNNFLMLSAYGK